MDTNETINDMLDENAQLYADKQCLLKALRDLAGLLDAGYVKLNGDYAENASVREDFANAQALLIMIDERDAAAKKAKS
jgi:hypothetical protein